MNTPLSNEVLAAWHDNRKVEAIKLLREQTGLGLKESKDLLESLDSTGSMPRPTTADEQDLAKQQLREQLEKMGVKDADALLDSMGHSSDGSDGSGGNSFTSVTRTSKTVNGKTTSTLSVTGNPEAAAQLLMSTTDMELDEARAQIDAAMKSGQKLEAVKRLREITGLGLAEAKDHIDSAMTGEPLDWHALPVRKASAPSTASATPYQADGYAPGEVPRGQSKPWWILVLIALAVAGWYYFQKG